MNLVRVLTNALIAVVLFFTAVLGLFVVFIASIVVGVEDSWLAKLYFTDSFTPPALAIAVVCLSCVVICFIALCRLSERPARLRSVPRKS